MTILPRSSYADEEAVFRLDQPALFQGTRLLSPTGDSRASFLDQTAPFVISLRDESGGFSNADLEAISIYGESAARTRFSIQGFDVSHPLFPGAALVRAPSMLVESLEIRGPELGGPGIEEQLRTTGRAYYLRGQLGGVGGIIPGARDVLEAFSGKHALDRGRPPLEGRRSKDGLSLGLLETLGETTMGLDVRGSRRNFPRVTGDDFEAALEVDAGLIMDRRWTLVMSHRERPHALIEAGRSFGDTQSLESTTLLAGVQGDQRSLAFTFGHLHSGKPATTPYELFDLDGQGRGLPLTPGHTWIAGLSGSVEDWHGTYAHTNTQLIIGIPRQATWSRTTELAGHPEGTFTYQVEDSAVGLAEGRLGARHQETFGGGSLSADLYAHLSAGWNDSGKNTVVFPGVGASIQARFPRFLGIEPYAVFRHDPVAVSPSLVLALNPSGLSRTHRSGCEDPRGCVERTLGGRFTTVAPDLMPPDLWIAALGLEAPVTEALVFELSGAIRRFDGLPRITLEDPDRVGYWVDDHFVYRRGVEPRYRLESSPDPATYFGGHLQFRTRAKAGDTPSFLFSFSFSAYSAIGHPPLGNGPEENDVFSLLPHDPNAERFGLASLDQDRAFVTKLWLAGRLLDGASDEPRSGLWLSFALAHEDGEPFSFLLYDSIEGQTVTTLASNRGSPLHYDRPLLGPREDFQLTADLELGYGFDVAGWNVWAGLQVSNAFDLGSERAEAQDVFGRGERAAIELGPPRSVSLTVGLH